MRTNYTRVFMVLVAAGLALGLLALAAGTKPAKAAFPGENGRIAFYKQTGYSNDIFKVFPGGSGTKQVTYSGLSETSPAWSPDGDKIAFVRNYPTVGTEIIVKDTRNGQQTRLTNDSSYEDDPAWSPDGSKIVFSRNSTGNQDIWVMNADGTGAKSLTTDPGYENEPAWSPDGTKIAFRKDFREIWVMNADGTGSTNLYADPGQNGGPENPSFPSSPAWSPDGAKIAFDGIYYVDAVQGNTADIYAMNADGTGRVNLTNTPAAVDAGPAWSPNGNKIAFLSQSYEPFSQDIFTMNRDGANLTNVTNTPTEQEWAPDWQPRPEETG